VTIVTNFNFTNKVDSQVGESASYFSDLSDQINALQKAVAINQRETHEMKTILTRFLKECPILRRERIW